MELSLKNVVRVFGNQRAVDDISFTARPGITGFLGPNGAGKSTTMRMITGYLPPTSGALFLNDEPLWPTTPQRRKPFGYLPEHNPVYPELYVREYLRFVAGIYRLSRRRQRVEDVVELVGLQREVGKKIGQLSKGYRQRVGLAQALIHDPEVLILDEPTNGLDPNQLSEIREVIRELGKQKIVLLSTHIMQEVQALCSRVVIINQGRLVADDTIEHINRQAAGGQQIFLRVGNQITAAMLKKLAGVQKVSAREGGFVLNLEAGEEQRATLVQHLVTNNIPVYEIRPLGSGMEYAFQALTSDAI